MRHARRFRSIVLLAQALLIGAPGSALIAPTLHAAPACVSESEPNDAIEAAPGVAGPLCVTGALPNGDQDLWIWTVAAADAATRWTFDLTGVPGTLTSIAIFPVTSPPGTLPVVAGSQIADVTSQPDANATVPVANLLLAPGEYVLGISRTALADGSDPAATDYRWEIARGDPLPPVGEIEPNDEPMTGTPLADAFAISADRAATVDYYAWTVSTDASAMGWEFRGQTRPGATLTVDILGPDGALLTSLSSGPLGLLDARDFAFAPGLYTIKVYAGDAVPDPYELAAVAGVLPEHDREPNDTLQAASVLDPERPVARGRLDHPGDVDTFRLDIPAGGTGRLVDARVIWKSDLDRTVCLALADGSQLQCKTGRAGVSLSNLALPAGAYYLTVGGVADPDDPYVLRLDTTSLVGPGFEAEPNDGATTASAFDLASGVSGRFDGQESDFLAVVSDADPQLYRLSVVGDGIRGAALVDSAGSTLMTADVAADGMSASLTDMFLVPGRHVFRLDGDAGAYTVTLTPLGPPDPNAEREPNNDPTWAGSLPLGVERTGRLVEASDRDVYRLSLAAPEHVVFTLTPPNDGAIVMRIDLDGRTVGAIPLPTVGVAVTYDAALLPGDYVITLSGATVSEGHYRFLVDRADPFDLAADQEPNDAFDQARPLPPSLTADGTVGEWGDVDWFLLPTLPVTTNATVTIRGGAYGVAVSDGIHDYLTIPNADGTVYTADQLPAGVPLALRISGQGAYSVEVAFADDVVAAIRPKPLKVVMAIAADTDRVAAYWPAGQRFDAELTIKATGIGGGKVTLDAVTSNAGWTVELGETTAELRVIGKVRVPIVVRVQPNAWADEPVRITVRARNASGEFATAWIEITPDRLGDPVNPEQVWAVPDALLGGLDVASLALGAQVVPAYDPAAEALLHDGLSQAVGGLSVANPTLPVTLTVDLAGDASVPVAGILLDPVAANAAIWNFPRAFRLELSDDGVTFAPALAAELAPYRSEQAFTLPAPVGARYARLVILSTWGLPASAVTLGEWKVVATPGWAPSDQPVNLADPALGGHIVFTDPQTPDIATPAGMLTEDPTRITVTVAQPVLRWVLGFQHDRVAQLTRLEWVDPPGSDPAARMTTVTVEVSLTSPLGPWTSIGTWDLVRAGDGSVAPLEFAEPRWARFVRLTGAGPTADTTTWELPATLRAIEAPTGDSYRSVFGEWGSVDFAGPWELANPSALFEPADDSVSDDTPAQAQPLAAGATAAGTVHMGEDVDWYEIAVPADRNTLELSAGGNGFVAVKLTLQDATGANVPMTFEPGEDGAVVYQATVTPGATYRVLVEQPIHSVVFTFDTSMSLAGYLPYVYGGIRAFAGSVQPGVEFANIVPFEADPLLEDWSDQPFVLHAAIDGYVDASLSSAAEVGLLASNQLLVDQEGARGIMLITDGETTSFDRNTELWTTLATVRPVIFAVHIGGYDTVAQGHQFMEDWAVATGGAYVYAADFGDLDHAFDRLATTLRRPAAYTLRWEAANRAIATATPDPTASPLPTDTPEPSATPTPTATPAPSDTPTPTATPAPSDTPTPTATATATATPFPTVAAIQLEPGALQILPPDSGRDEPALVTSAGAVEIILDTSGSMLQEIEPGRTRADVAKIVLTDLVTNTLPTGLPIVLRTFGDQPDSCDTRLVVPLAPLDPAAMATVIAELPVVNLVKTPIGAALLAVAEDLADVDGPKVIVLVTDGEETCGGDPGAAIQALMEAGYDVHVNIVGLSLGDEALKETFREWARVGRGSYFDATSSEELNAAVALAVLPPFTVTSADGVQVATGIVGGDPIDLPPGDYTVTISSEPELVLQVTIVSAETTVVEAVVSPSTPTS